MEGSLGEIRQISNNIWKEYCRQKDIEQQNCEMNVRILCNTSTKKTKNVILIEYDSIPSTMVPADRWPRQKLQEQDIYCFIAKEQGEGVGQKSNKWISPRGNIYMTMLTKYRLQRLQELVIRVNNSVVKLLQQLCRSTSRVKSKWVNDIFINDKKVSGALIRNEFLSADTVISQIGIGVNVQNAPSIEFSCLSQHSSTSMDISQIIELLINTLVEKLFNSHDFSSQLKLYQSNLLYFQEKVTIYNSQLTEKLYQGIFVGINEHGHAMLQIQGQIKAVSDGRMRPYLMPSDKPLNIREIMKEL